MEQIESIESFYKRKFNWIPENIRQELGHFNVFKLDPYVGPNAQPVPYKRRDFYKITLVIGQSRVHYADKVVQVEKQALAFSNPRIPYKWESIDSIRTGYFCIFNDQFFHQFGKLTQYEIYHPSGPHVFELSDEQRNYVESVFQKMDVELSSNYVHKYDVLRNHVFELIHYALKMQPSLSFENKEINASLRISTMFMELLERQFPIDDSHHALSLRTPSDYAEQLNVHVNHLNRSLKEVTSKTTSQIIADRITQEAKILLRYSSWSSSEIAYALGFKEVTHFNNFFKKQVNTSPLKFRNV